MYESAIEGLVLVFQWPAIGYLFLGVFAGMWIGAVPGLGGAIGLVLLLPFTFAMDTVPAFALLLGMYVVTATSDTIASVLLGIPGTVASQATILDGFPLAKKGQAARAFGAAYTVSAVGGVVGALLLAVSLPVIMPIIFAFGVAEFFMLAVLGLTMVGVLSGRSIIKGLVIAVFGLLITTIGYADATGVPRYYLGSDYLLDGLPIIPVVLGLFGVPEVMELAVKKTSISRVERDERDGGMMRGVRDAIRYRWLALRSAVMGTYIGMLPGLGGAIVDWIAYGHAVQSAKDKSEFGHGDIRGVIAPEAANNAHKAGALIPTVTLGIPGSLGAAILLGALVIKGLTPGPDMLTVDLPVTMSMIWDIAIANVLAAGLLLAFSRYIERIAFVPGQLIVPGVIVVLFMGAWVGSNAMGDWWVCLAFGLLGYWMKQGGWSRPPLILALVLGGLMENNFLLSVRIHDGYSWLYERPIVIVIEILIVITVVLAARGLVQKRRAKAKRDSEAAEGGIFNPLLSLPLGVIMLGFFLVLGWQTAQFELAATAQFPFAILLAAVPLGVLALLVDLRAGRAWIRESASLPGAWRAAADKADVGASLAFLGFLLAMILLTILVGQLIALALFAGLYFVLWTGYSWRIAIAYAGGAALLVWGFYDRLMNLNFYPSVLFG